MKNSEKNDNPESFLETALTSTLEKEFDDLAELARELCKVPYAFISFFINGEQIFKASKGIKAPTISVKKSLCRELLERPNEITVLEDINQNPNYQDHPLVNRENGVVFHAGAPLIDSQNNLIGSICVQDQKRRKLSDAQIQGLRKLANQVVHVLELNQHKIQLEKIKSELEKEHLRVHNLILATKVGTWEWDILNNELHYSSSWAEMIGYTLEELGTIDRETRVKFIHPEDLETSNLWLESCLQGKNQMYECEVRMKHKNGSWIWVLDRGQVMDWDQEGNPARMFGTHTNITGQVIANQEIIKREKRFRTLVENSDEAVAILGLDGKPTYVSPSIHRVLGYSESEAMKISLDKLVHPDDFAGVEKQLQAALANPGKSLPGHPARVQHKNGSWRWVSATITNMLHDPVINGIVDNFKDITTEYLAKENLQKSEKRFKTLAQEGADLVTIISPQGTYNYLSPNYESYLGQKIETLIGQVAEDFIHPEDVKQVRRDFSAIDHKRQIKGRPFRMKHQEDGWRWLQSVATNLIDDPDIQGIVVNSVDVTAIIRAQNLLKKSNERFELVMKAGSESIWDFNPKNQSLFLGDGFRKSFNFQIQSEAENNDLINQAIHPEDKKRVLNSFRAALKNKNQEVWEMEFRLLRGPQDYAYVYDKAVILRDKTGKAIRAVGAMRDISREHYFRTLEAIEKEVMEASFKENASEKTIFDQLILQLEELIPDLKGSILRVKDDQLRNLSSPSLTNQYISEIEGQPIGLNQGSCGTSAFLKENVLVDDVQKSPYWQDFRELAQRYQIGACWSFPVISAGSQVIGTVAYYFPYPKSPSAQELETLERTHRLVSILMAKFDYLEKIRSSNERYEYVNKSTNEAIFDWDVEKDIFTWGESFTRVFGHQIDFENFTLSHWRKLMHPEDGEKKEKEWEQFIKNPDQSRWDNTFRFLKEDQTYAFVEEKGFMIRDKQGKAIRMIGVLRDQTQLHIDQEQKELKAKISELFKTDQSLLQIYQAVCQLILDFGNFEITEIWLKGNSKTKLKLVGKSIKHLEYESIYTHKQTISELSKGSGLPGAAWKTGSVQVWNHLEKNPNFIRSQSAKEFGLKSGIAIPIESKDEIIGSCLILCSSDLEKDLQTQSILQVIQEILGKEIERKQQEEELMEFFENAPDILAIATPNGYFSKVNPAFCQLMGYSAEELTTRPFIDYVHPDDLSDTSKEYQETKSGERLARNFVNRYRTKSGEYRYISWSSSGIFGSDSNVFAFGRDITELKKLEELLHNASKLSRVGGWEVNLLTKEIKWSKMTHEIHETDQNTILTLENALEFYRKEYRDMVNEKVRKAMESGENYEFEAPVITAKGKERWIRSIGEAEMVDGKCIRIFGSIQDIHERKMVEMRFKSVSDSIPGVIFQYVLNPDGSNKLQHVSQGSYKIWGLSPEDCVRDSGLVWTQVAMGGDIENLRKSIEDSARNLSNWNCEWRVLSHDGKIRYLKGVGTPHKMADGRIIWDSLVMDTTDQKNLENLLEQSARMAKIGSWEVIPDADPLLLQWSNTTREILESDKQGIELESAYSFYQGEYKNQAREAMERLIRFGVGFDIELLLTTPQGNSKWIRCIGNAQVVNGLVLRAYGSFQDIHDRKVAEIDLQELLEERNTILESIGDGFFAVDLKFKVTYWNYKAEQMLRISRESILGKNLWDVFDDEANPVSRDFYQKAMKTGKIQHFEDYFAKYGRWFDVSVFPSEMGLTVYFKDVTSEKLAKAELEASNERFELVAKATNDAIWDYDILNDQLFWGKGFQTLFGYDPDLFEPRFEKLIGLIHQEDRPRIIEKIEEMMKSSESNHWIEEYRFLKADGSYSFVADRASFIRNTKGIPIRAIGAMSDITERKSYEESLKRLNENLEKQAKELAISNSELEQFAYIASHDLQEPLRMVSSFLSQLERRYQDQLDEKALRYIDFAKGGAVRMRQIILDLLEFSRVGKQEEEIKPIDLREVIKEVGLLQKRLLEEKNGQLLFRGNPKVKSYPSPLLQVLHNLIGNAIKYSKPDVPPIVEVTCKELADHWSISVSDNGIGIKTDYFDKIFVIFQRLHRKEEYNGTGMGLAIVKKIIEGLGGKIWVESNLDVGSTFTFTLPKKPV
ncbi:PAS domain-containing protein [Algoriphagus sp.]|uniref:PAS domain-containing protein n=1 Tax=Algoriphagus sp. TaxID=1872435 RepID=UPI0026224898|nr:PAS domain-containing protein [Algoriphagus sp.]